MLETVLKYPEEEGVSTFFSVSYVFGQLAQLLRSPEVIAAICDLTKLTPRQVSDALDEILVCL